MDTALRAATAAQHPVFWTPHLLLQLPACPTHPPLPEYAPMSAQAATKGHGIPKKSYRMTSGTLLELEYCDHTLCRFHMANLHVDADGLGLSLCFQLRCRAGCVTCLKSCWLGHEQRGGELNLELTVNCGMPMFD